MNDTARFWLHFALVLGGIMLAFWIADRLKGDPPPHPCAVWAEDFDRQARYGSEAALAWAAQNPKPADCYVDPYQP